MPHTYIGGQQTGKIYEMSALFRVAQEKTRWAPRYFGFEMSALLRVAQEKTRWAPRYFGLVSIRSCGNTGPRLERGAWSNVVTCLEY